MAQPPPRKGEGANYGCSMLCIPCTIFCGCGRNNCENKFEINNKEEDYNNDTLIENQEEEHGFEDKN